MRFHVLTIFPQVFPGTLGVGVVARAIAAGDLSVTAHDLRDWTENKHRQVDDIQFGGGAGMVLKPEPIIHALRDLRAAHPGLRSILLSPQGRPFTQPVARELAQESDVLLVCGRYQGVDQRARDEIGEELSIGDYVLSGGEVAALAVIEATARMIPGVLGDPESLEGETFSGADGNGFEAPLYTRPASFEGKDVPAVLRNGNHAEIAQWRLTEAQRISRRSRPDLAGTGTSNHGGQL